MKTVKERKLAYFRHLMRNEKYRLLQLVMQLKIGGSRVSGRCGISWLRNFRQWAGRTSIALFRAAANKAKWSILIANVQ